MKAAFFSTITEITVKETPVPEIGSGDLLIKVRACGLCGTDIKKLHGKGLQPPLVLGHEIVGVIEKAGSQVNGFCVGDRVVVAHHVPCFSCIYCRHENYSMCETFKQSNVEPGGFAEYLRIPQTHVRHTTFKIPDDLADEKALFTEPLACAVRCLKRVALLPGDTVLLIGFGSIGMLLFNLLKRIPAKVLVSDLAEKRLKQAKKLGALPVYPTGDDLSKMIHEQTQGKGVDLVLFTAGTKEMLAESFAWVRDGGTICLFSDLAGKSDTPIDTTQLYRREITLNSSYSPGPKDLQEAFELITSHQVDLDEQEMQFFKLDEIDKAIALTLERKIVKAVVQL